MRVNQPLGWSFFQQNFIISQSQDTDIKPRPLTVHVCLKPCTINIKMWLYNNNNVSTYVFNSHLDNDVHS